MLPTLQKRAFQIKAAELLCLVVLALASPANAASTDAPRPVIVFAPGLFSLRVVQQNGDSNFVDARPGYATQFRDAAWYGTIGILAHDYSSGKHFYSLAPGQQVILIFRRYAQVWRIVTVFEYYPSPALTPEQMFDIVYTHGGLVFQTCKDNGYIFAVGSLERVIGQ